MENAGLRGMIEKGIAYTRLLWGYRWLIIGITSAATLPTLAFLAASVLLPPDKSPMPNTYTARGTILIQPASNDEGLYRSIIQSIGGSYAEAGGGSFDNGELVQEILVSNPIIDQAVDTMGLVEFWKLEGEGNKARATARDTIRSSLGMEYTRATGSLRIYYTDINPEFAATMVNNLVSYLGEWFNLNRGASKQRQKEILEEGIATVTKEIARIQKSIKELQERYGFLEISDLSASRTALLENIRQRITDKDLEIRQYAAISTIDDARMAQLRQELADLQEYYAEQQRSVSKDSRLASDGVSAAEIAQRFNQLSADLLSQQQLQEALTNQYRVAKLTYESAPIFQVLEAAEPPLDKTGPNRTKLLVMAFGGGLLGSVALALLVNMLRKLRAEMKKAGRFSWPED